MTTIDNETKSIAKLPQVPHDAMGSCVCSIIHRNANVFIVLYRFVRRLIHLHPLRQKDFFQHQ